MRFIRVFLAICVFFLAVIFAVQNSEFLGQTSQFRLDLYVFDTVLTTIPLPLYFVILVAFLMGSLAAIALLICDRIRIGFNLGRARRRIKNLEQELNSLRTLPLTTTSNVVLSEEKSLPAPVPLFNDTVAEPDNDTKPSNPPASI
jgi:uncharacterized integral membrane protein